MDVSSVLNTKAAAQTTGAGSGEGVGSSTLDYNSFLTLLIAQMKNQDPMEPMASSDYVAQLATFSQVEKTVQTNERLASLLNTGNLQLAESLIGRAVVDTISQVGGTVVAAKVVDNGVMVLLDNGSEFMVGSGLIIGEAIKPSDDTPAGDAEA
jgi:flagellar basal-body rod modification protein FlgD